MLGLSKVHEHGFTQIFTVALCDKKKLLSTFYREESEAKWSVQVHIDLEPQLESRDNNTTT